MAVAAKDLDQKIAQAKARLAKLEALKSGKMLDKTSPGMVDLISSLDNVCSTNGCNVLDVINAISRMKKLGLKIERPPRKARTKKVTSS